MKKDIQKLQKGLHEAYAQDPIKADLEVFGRESNGRRGFLRKSSLLAMASIIGSNIPFAKNMPAGVIPALFANSDTPFSVAGKDGLIYLNDKPITAETPVQFLDAPFTAPEHFFIRNNGNAPEEATLDPKKWTLEIAGESCKKPQTFTIEDLKKKFKTYTYALVVECAGNSRAEIVPATKGNQWKIGAVACGRWTGVRLKDVLEYCGVKKDAVYIGYYGSDTRLDGNADKATISRGVPIEKALEEESLIAWDYEGAPIPYMNGFPLRLVIGGWSASVSGKWLKKIVVRNKVHDGEKMNGQSYRMPCKPVAPGEQVPDSQMCVLGGMVVKSIITHPLSGIKTPLNKTLEVRGKAWAGDRSVKEMWVSIDFGATWQKANLKKPLNRFSWQEWNANIKFPEGGYYEVWARAVDDKGVSQPMVLPGWNPRGYLSNSCHRIAVRVI